MLLSRPVVAAVLLAATASVDAFIPSPGSSSLARPAAAFVPKLTPSDVAQEGQAQIQAALVAGKTALSGWNDQLSASYQSSLASIVGQMKRLEGTSTYAQLQAALADVASQIQSQVDALLLPYPELASAYQTLSAKLSSLSSDSSVEVVLSGLVSYLAISAVLNLNAPPAPSRPYPLGKYDPVSARAYFDRRLPQVIGRATEIAVASIGFGIGLLQDKLDGKLETNGEVRGTELAKLLTKLGPTFIKVGQSLSIRTDILSPDYIRGLQSLQDQVPAFDTKIARQIMEDEWGAPVSSVLKTMSDEPVAAASLGQVYKGTMMDGTEVAVKVQRPNIMSQVALDMNLLREFAPFAKRTFNLNTDAAGVVDAWGSGFVDELDYLQEAANGKDFMERIQETPLKDVVLAPRVVDEISTGKVLVTEWVDGERLDKSNSEDITVLCSICMNTYLTMLLELGALHCDPHPGNLLRTTDGKLCILDWGMVTVLPPVLQLTLLEHMAHLTSADYAEIPRDLLLLGFVPEDKADVIEGSGVVEVLSSIYGQWTSGGGVAGINVNDVISQMQDLTAEKGNLFQIPPYFAYIAKSFSVLEGIGLSNDPKYSIINECLPYVSQRLLTDQDSMGPALSTFVFGPQKAEKDRIVDIDRVEQLVTGFGNYTTSASGALLGKEGLSRTEQLESAADQVLSIIFAEEETPVQEILVEQLAKIVSSGSRSVWADLRKRSGTLPSGRSLLGTIVDPLGIFKSSPLVRVDELDAKTVDMTRRLVALMQTQLAVDNQFSDLGEMSREESAELSSILVRKVWEKRSGLVKTSNRFATALLKITADKLQNGGSLRGGLQSEPAHAGDEARTSVKTPVMSDRLASAKSRLSQLETEDEKELTVTAE